MSSAASGIIEAIKEQLGEGTNWDYIPLGGDAWFYYGLGGIGGWGTLCGVPNGCCIALNMAGATGLTAKVLEKYSATSWPTSAVPDAWRNDGTWAMEPIPDNEVLAHTISYNPICHISISKWCDEAGVDLLDTTDDGRKFKNDRCGKVCADMAAFTAELLNGCSYTYVPYSSTPECQTCHHSGSLHHNVDPYPPSPAANGQMDCAFCHNGEATIIEANHPAGPLEE